MEEIGSCRFSTYPSAVEFLLEMYGTDQAFESFLDKLHHMVQPTGEKQLQLATLLRSRARRCCPLFTRQDLVSRFGRGVSKDLRPLLRFKLGYLTEFREFTDYVEQAAAMRDSHRSSISRIKPSQRLQHISRLRALSMESRDSPAKRVSLRGEYPATVLAIPHEELQVARSDHSDSSILELPRYSRQQSDSGHGILPALRRGVSSYIEPPRQQKPGWRFPSPELFKGPLKDSPSHICIKCYAIGHKRPTCPVQGPNVGNR